MSTLKKGRVPPSEDTETGLGIVGGSFKWNEVEEKKDDKDTTPEEPPKDDTFQAFAVLGIALVAMGEEIGSEMSLRQFNHLVRFCSCLTVHSR